LNYKQQFRQVNNELSFWGGRPYGKSEFLRIITLIREKALTQRVIRNSFKDRGIYPVNKSKVLDNLSNGFDNLPVLYTPELRSAKRTLSLSLQELSSSVENSPPNTIEALERNHAKILRDIAINSEKTQRNLSKAFLHQREKFEELAMTQDSIRRIRSAQAP
jgi:hypothetical protein